MSKIKKKKQDILYGSSILFDKQMKLDTRTEYMLKNIKFNATHKYLHTAKPSVSSQELEKKLRSRFLDYRENWKNQPNKIMRNELFGKKLKANYIRPLCLDIEIASICDLACGFCYREYLATPDKIIKPKLYYKLIDQAAELKIPSVKLNWRGEPLLHPKIGDFIRYAKQKGILEVIINTNATNLTLQMSKDLIDAGLDYMIYSFDGGSKETYEKMRPGRFKKNSFEKVYNNIVNFSKIKKEKGALFPRTKIQMILTEDTFNEQEAFFSLFKNYVDEVTVTQYSERGGNFNDLSIEDKIQYKKLIEKFKLNENAPYLKDSDGNLKVSVNRKPCEQPFQRLMVTYDGRVAMCCFDWGAMHTIGYVDDMSFKDLDQDKKDVLNKVENKHKGFELMSFIKMPPKFNIPEKKVSTLIEIWTGKELEKVHQKHAMNLVNDIKICKGCSFKDTYEWKK